MAVFKNVVQKIRKIISLNYNIQKRNNKTLFIVNNQEVYTI